MHHTPDTVTLQVKKLRELLQTGSREGETFTITCSSLAKDAEDVEAWERAGVDRLIVTPWTRSPEAIDAMRSFAERMMS